MWDDAGEVRVKCHRELLVGGEKSGLRVKELVVGYASLVPVPTVTFLCALAPVHKTMFPMLQGFIGKVIYTPKEHSCCTHEVLQRYLDSLLPTTYIEHTLELTP